MHSVVYFFLKKKQTSLCDSRAHFLMRCADSKYPRKNAPKKNPIIFLSSAIVFLLAVWLDLPPYRALGDPPGQPSSKPAAGQVMARR